MTAWIVQTETRAAPSGPGYEQLVGPCEIVYNPSWRDRNGYAQVMRRGGRKNTRHRKAHRFVWELYRGPIPEGMFVLHACDTPACVALDHLRLGTVADNNRDRVERGRSVAGERHHNSRLTDELVIEIRERHAAGGITLQELAAEYGVGRHAIWCVVKRKTWRHV